MNKIYINETGVTINQDQTNEGIQIHFDELRKLSLPVLISKASQNDWQSDINIWGASSAEVMDFLTRKLPVLVAGGGLVQNPSEEVLFIYRKNCWVLPKGKPENGESIELTAIREVEEECGISGLEIIAALPTTYHIYSLSPKQHILKRCYWFHMISHKWKHIHLQMEEEITDARWASIPVTDDILSNAFPSIRDLVRYFQQDYLRIERRS